MDGPTTTHSAPPGQAAVASEAASGLKGAELIRSLVPRLPNAPGVYRMQDERGEVLYVGKAKSLKKRVPAYTKLTAMTARLVRMVSLTRSMEFVTTASEVEALLLEANLIKRYRPMFNIVLRDDKSFPYIYLRYDHEWPMIGRQRGAKREGRDYFGPFASSGAVNDTLNALLRAFPLRSCQDSIFNVRSRPCLQYQIKRCTAPCVGRIDHASYAHLVNEVKEFLNGRTRDVQARLQGEMEGASQRLDFEAAAVYRDRLKAVAHIASRQGINTDAVEDADIVAMHAEHGQACVQVFFYRGGRNYGNRAYYPAHTRDSTDAEVMAAFIAQFYSDRQPARLVLTSHDMADQALLGEALAVRAGRKVEIGTPQRGGKRQLVQDALKNAREALARRMADNSAQEGLLETLGERLGLDLTPQRIEVYDNSHIQGTDAIGAFIVSGAEGFDRKSYRTFNIKGAGDGTPGNIKGAGDGARGINGAVPAESDAVDASEVTGETKGFGVVAAADDTVSPARAAGEFRPGDDFAMMREVLRRRFGRLVKDDPTRASGNWPDLVVIDGGAGQLSAVLKVLDELDLGDLAVLGVAKGPDRNAGRERFFMRGREPFSLDPRDPVLYFLQRLRDEAHRFAISTHRGRRSKAIGRSELDGVPGIGSKRKKALLQHFGSARGVGQAGLRDLEQVPGINKAVARQVYDHFHDSR